MSLHPVQLYQASGAQQLSLVPKDHPVLPGSATLDISLHLRMSLAYAAGEIDGALLTQRALLKVHDSV